LKILIRLIFKEAFELYSDFLYGNEKNLTENKCTILGLNTD